jgi:hypothetical protein
MTDRDDARIGLRRTYDAPSPKDVDLSGTVVLRRYLEHVLAEE